MGKVNRSFELLLATILLVFTTGTAAHAAPTAAEITGEIERLTLNDPTDVYSGGVMIVGGSQVILPKNLLIDLPANRLSLQQIFDQAPAACKSAGESGLAKADRCNASGAGGFATLSGVHSNAGNIIAGDVLIEKGKEVVSGVISYISYTDGYFRVNGLPNDASTGALVRLNDPTSRHTIQQGLGCAGGPNCSPDPRFTLDPDNYVSTFSSGYPLCIPSTVSRNFADVLGLGTTTAQATATGTGDALCPATNRTPGVAVEPDVNDSRLFAPIMVGDSVNAEGSYETVNGVRFLSSHTTRINKALSTKNLPTQPDYMFLEEVFLEAPGFQNQRARMLIIGFTTLANPGTDVDFWTIHRDPATNAVHEFPLASVQGCDNAVGIASGKPGFPNGSCSQQGLIGAGGNIFRIRYDVDFLLAASNNAKYPGGAREDLNPCMQLRASPRFTASNPGICSSGITLANNFGIMSPIPHEIQARTGHSLDNPGIITLDINGRRATNGQYLFPFGINLGGVETADFLEIDINLLNTPRVFEGIPWNLDRRLSPSGCLKPGGCEATPQLLDPFPFTGLDPRLQAEFLVAGLPGGTPKGPYNDSNYTASLLGNASNRVFSYVDPVLGKFNGNNTLLPCAVGNCPPDPGLITINPTPALSIFGPAAIDDASVTAKGVAVTINVLGNDVPTGGVIDPATVKVVSPPVNGTTVVNFDGSITYTPKTLPPFTGADSFTYTVANNVGAVSNAATVTVQVTARPVAADDTASTTTAALPLVIDVIANDTAGYAGGFINPSSVSILTQPGTNCGSVANPANGTLVYTPNAAGTCAFSYMVSDSSTPPLNSNVATVTVTVAQGNIPPVANPDTAFTTVNSTVIVNLLANDTTTSSFNLNSVVITTSPPQGTLSPIGNGVFSYVAPANAGTYQFAYTVADVNNPPNTSQPAIVTVTVAAPPVAVDDVDTLDLGLATSSKTIAVLVNDTPNATLNPASVVIASQSANGAAVANANGTVTYIPNPGYVSLPNTPDTFTYTVRDNLNVVSNPATVSVTVTGPATPTVTVTNAQFIVSGASWRIDGTTTARGVGMQIYNGATVQAAALLGTAVVDQQNGNWTFSLDPVPPDPGTQPDASLMISVQSDDLTPSAKLEGVTLVVR